MFVFVFRLVQNLVFYGVSQSTGWKLTFEKGQIMLLIFSLIDTWKLRPHASFAVSAVVELIAYIFVHMILDRVGRKIPYCTFAILFGITAIMILPVQTFFEKDSSSKKLECQEFFVVNQGRINMHEFFF